MASIVLSSTSYLNYLNDYVNILLKSTNRYLIEHLNKSYFDEIEILTRFLLAQWYSEQKMDQVSLLYIENVGHLHRKLGFLTKLYRLNHNQLERIENLLFHTELIQLITSIIQSLLLANIRHNDDFLQYFSILIDAYSVNKSTKSVLHHLTQQVFESTYYKQYLIESISSNIEGKHLFFIGAIGQLAESNSDLTRNQLYSQFLQRFYQEKQFPNDSNIHYCTLGILSQIDITYLISDYTCISILVAMFLNKETSLFILPILNIFNALCIQSKTIACYLNTDPLIEILLRYVTDYQHSQIHINACLLLGHIVSEQQLVKFRISYKLAMKLFDLLNDYQEDIDPILHSLLTLTIHEQIQNIIAETYQLKKLIDLSEKFSICYEIIWKLSFHSKIIKELVTKYKDFVQNLSTTSPENGILENIRTKNASRLPSTNEISSDISLVFSTKDESVVNSIKEKLLNKNLQIGTPSNSSHILLCISEECKHDCSCQATIRQALIRCQKLSVCIVQKSYRIDDWFSKLHIQQNRPYNILKFGLDKFISEFQKDFEQHHNHQRLPALSKKTRIVSPIEQNVETTFTLSTPSPLPSLVSSKTSIKRIQNWTNRDVCEWCEGNKLSAFTKILTSYDGRSLLALAQIARMSAPHTIINQLRTDCRKQGLNLTFVEYVRFQTALNELVRVERNRARKQSVSTTSNRYVFRGKSTTTNQT